MHPFRSDDYLEEAPIAFSVLAADGTILYANAAEAEFLGLERDILLGRSADTVYSAPTIKRLNASFDKAQSGALTGTQSIRVALRTKGGQQRELPATFNISSDPQHGFIMRLVKFLSGPTVAELERVERDNDVLAGFLATARDATYCIEFDEPVDLTAPEHEIIRQVFENACHWRYCNEAMGRIYSLASCEDLNMRDVREVFPRNPDNEAFIRMVIEGGWHVNSAPSRDHRYDGADIFVDNDVRAHIVDGWLHRFWGVVRDRSGQILKERHLKAEAGQALDLLGAVPDPIIVINREGRVEGANPALEWWLGWPLCELLGTKLDSILKFDVSMRVLATEAGPGKQAIRRYATALCSDGRRLSVDVNVATISLQEAQGRLVMTLRTTESHHDSANTAVRRGA